ncbi:hypothetical protein BSL78_21088 [Apostichopus japonicus]|uniref:Uncharacterized protein n=1 Tax=Stichopus japonicus TaxID=307972 RepID=A0A2G8K237_STIJA|nr:hypothetical protein BSL78_21088 [Apostichopus japonicus]
MFLMCRMKEWANHELEYEPADHIGTVACVMVSTPNSQLGSCCVNEGKVTLKCGNTLPLMSAACDVKFCRKAPVEQGRVNGRVVSVLRDSGCDGVIIRRELVLPEQFTGQLKPWALADGTIRTIPVARLRIDTPFFSGIVEASCFRNPLYDILLGNIDGVRGPGDPDPNWSKTTDGKSREKVGAVQTRAQKAAIGKPLPKLNVPKALPKVKTGDFKKAQMGDVTLSKCRRLAILMRRHPSIGLGVLIVMCGK